MEYNKKIVGPLFRTIASNGTAPNQGCELFGAGYEDAFARLLEEIVEGVFEDGCSAERFIVGPYGSGKTHFLRQFCALAEDRGCVTSEISLTKALDYTNGLVVYKEIAKHIKPPESTAKGIKGLLTTSLDKAKETFTSDDEIDAWITTFEEHQFKNDDFGRVVCAALKAIQEDDRENAATLCRWLQGEIDNRNLIKSMPLGLFVNPVPKAQHGLVALQLMCSLAQFVRLANYKGTVICYDEAEQGLAVSAKKEQIVMSLLLSEINVINDLQDGSLLILYAFTNDLEARFANLDALSQRLATPPGGCFFKDKNTYAAVINLTLNAVSEDNLKSMGHKLADLYYEYFDEDMNQSIEETKKEISQLAKNAFESDASCSHRREFMRQVALNLLRLSTGQTLAPEPPPQEDEV